MKNTTPTESPAGRWISYRKEIKILDCTVRDGGLMNDHKFDDRVVKAVYQACVEGGIDYMEVGYKASKRIFAKDKFGIWKFSDEEDLRRVLGDNDTPLKISVMADAERTDYHVDVLPKDQSLIDMYRIACYIHEIPTALDMVKDAHDKGYETTLNLMAISTVQERELDEALHLASESEVDALYLVDSFGALYSEQVRYLTWKYLQYASPSGKTVGMHAHNNQQLAYANTVEAIIVGANLLDASMAGLGRGAGNCPLELLMGFLHNPKFLLRPVLKCIQETIEPMREELKWGFDIPYMITGQLNQHPRSAIRFNESPDRGNILKFFDQIMEEE
ncbi:MAG: nucleoid-structuring protein H-NS [Lentisphaerae bacterium RIFOXYB12_FULL_65_16]|nr:MAG: nucleoid-structuring protein H-NS [Lentisphaerae bacterium RIFOXYA12_64_32]OGV89297.1 MAG: nucleoid-structuring protein H-NS [Lentisphaerae bacterium RIFOXYB12_FULL_65_16]